MDSRRGFDEPSELHPEPLPPYSELDPAAYPDAFDNRCSTPSRYQCKHCLNWNPCDNSPSPSASPLSYLSALEPGSEINHHQGWEDLAAQLRSPDTSAATTNTPQSRPAVKERKPKSRQWTWKKRPFGATRPPSRPGQTLGHSRAVGGERRKSQAGAKAKIIRRKMCENAKQIWKGFGDFFDSYPKYWGSYSSASLPGAHTALFVW